MKYEIALLKLSTIVLTVVGLQLEVAAGTIELSEPFPTRGKEVTISVLDDSGQSHANAAVVATYSPNASETITSDETIGVTNRQGVVLWRPQREGIVILTARDSMSDEVIASKNLSVKFSGIPFSGVVVFLIAGTILFGGIVYSYRRLMED